VLIFGQEVALFGAGETALWAETELVEVEISAGFVDAALDP
jgi:hypothetical protein